jgi:hypothetical protein
MGHASIGNLSSLFLKRIYAKGYTSIREMIDLAEAKGESVHASERDYKERYMFGMIFYHLIWWHFKKEEIKKRGRLNDLQKKVYTDFCNNGFNDFDDWDGGDDGESGEIGAFDSIRWEFTTKARKNYKDIELLQNFEN